MDQIETNLPSISSNYSTYLATLKSLESTAKQIAQRIRAFEEKTRIVHDTTMKLRYAYSSADGLKEKMQSVEVVMEGIQARMNKLSTRLEAVERLRIRHKLERRHRIRRLAITGVSICVVLALVYGYFW